MYSEKYKKKLFENARRGILFNSNDDELSLTGVIALGKDLSGQHYMFIQSRYNKNFKKIWINLSFNFCKNRQLQVNKFVWVLRHSPRKGGNDDNCSGVNLDVFEKEKPVDLYLFDDNGLMVMAPNFFLQKRATVVVFTQTNTEIKEMIVLRSKNKIFSAFADGSIAIWGSIETQILCGVI